MSDHRLEIPCPVQVGRRPLLAVLSLSFRVKLAINLVTKERVAIKLMNYRIDEACLDRAEEQKVMEVFLNEVRMASMARHRNVV